MQADLIHVSKSFGVIRRVRALQDVSARFERGRVHAVLGLNGAGKTTLLRILAGAAAPDSGQVVLDGAVLARDNLELRRRLVFLPDIPFLFHDRSVASNLGSFLRLWARDDASPEVAERAADILQNLDLATKADAPCRTLSRGQLYKTALAALLLIDPDLWVIDEPFASGMDARAIGFFRRAARDAVARGKTVIFTTQLAELTRGFASTLTILGDGVITAAGETEDVLAALAREDENAAFFDSEAEGHDA